MLNEMRQAVILRILIPGPCIYEKANVGYRAPGGNMKYPQTIWQCIYIEFQVTSDNFELKSSSKGHKRVHIST